MSGFFRAVGQIAGAVAIVTSIIAPPLAPIAAAVAAVSSTLAQLTAKPPAAVGQVQGYRIGANNPLPYLIGEAYTEGVELYREGYGGERDDVQNPYAFIPRVLSCCGPIEDIGPTYVNFAAVSFSSAVGSIREAQGYYADHLWIDEQLGQRPEASALGAPLGWGSRSRWGSSHKLSGMAAVAWSLKWSKKGRRFAGGQIPPLGKVPKGVKAYDPRADSTFPGGSGPQRITDESTWSYSRNPAVHAGTYAYGRLMSVPADSRRGKARLYVRVTANDGTMQQRVIGPFNFSPVAPAADGTEYDLTVEIDPDLPEVTGQRYQSFWPAISYVRTQTPHNPRFLITKAGKYEVERSPTNAEAPTDQYAITGRYTIEASVPGVSIGKLAYVTDALASIPGHRTYWRMRGSNLTLDTRFMTNWTARNTSTNPNDIQHWLDGVMVSTTDPFGKDELFRGGTTPRSSQILFGRPYYTECHFLKQNTPCNAASLVRGCLVEDSSQDIVSNGSCVVFSTFAGSDQDFWNADTPAFTVTIPAGDTLSRAGGNYSSGTNGGVWTAIVGGVTHTFDVGNGSELYFLGTPTNGYRGVSGIGGYWVSDVVDWLNTLPGWSATLNPVFAARDRVASALSRPGLVGQGFDVARGTQLVGDGSPRQIVWNVNTHGDWYQHSSGGRENAIIAFNRGWDLEVQLIFLSPILAGGTAFSRDMFFVCNLLSIKNEAVPGGWNPASGASQINRPQDYSHCGIVHNTLANQRWIPNFNTGNTRDIGYNLMKNNTARGFTWSGGVVAPNMVVDGLLIHEGQAVPDGVSNYHVAGNELTLYADIGTGDFTPTAVMRAVGIAPAVPFDANGTAFPSPCCFGGFAAPADALLIPPVIPEPTDVLGPAGLALASSIGDAVFGGMWLFSAAANPGLWRAVNLAGEADDFIQGTAAIQPAIGANGATFDSNDQIATSAFAGNYDVYLLLRKNAASIVGQIIRNQVILAEGSIASAAVAAGASVFVNGEPVPTRGALFSALDAESGDPPATRFAELRIQNMPLSFFELGRNPADAFQGDILAMVAVPRFRRDEAGEIIDATAEQIAAQRDLARAWMLELKPSLPAYIIDPPVLSAVSITGEPEDGEVLTANYTVTGDAPIAVTFQWRFNGTPIAGQTAQTITLNAAGMSLVAGGTLSCVITATNGGGTATQTPTMTYSVVREFVGSSTASAASGTSLTINAPAGAQVGDLLLFHSFSSSANPHATPTGWTLVATSIGYSLFRRIHDGSASYTFTTAASVAQAGQLLAWRGYSFGVASPFTSNVVDPTPNAITVPAANSRIVQFVGGGNLTWTMPAGWISRASFNSSTRSVASWGRDTLAEAGSLPGTTITRATGSSSSSAIAVSLTPA